MDDLKWTFRCYLDGSGIDAVDSWYNAQNEELQALFDENIRYLRYQPRENWIRPHFDLLSGTGKGLGEIRFKFKRVQYRPLGFFNGKSVFTFTLIATKTNKFEPKNALELSLKRKIEIELDKERARDCQAE